MADEESENDPGPNGNAHLATPSDKDTRGSSATASTQVSVFIIFDHLEIQYFIVTVESLGTTLERKTDSPRSCPYLMFAD